MRILITTDGSEFSKAAIEEYCRLFPELIANSKIKILSVYEEQYALAAEPFAVSAEYYQQMADAAERQAGHFSASGAALIRDKILDVDLDITIEIMKGPPEKQIVELAEEWGADLIVVGSHGRGFWKRAWLGSVSDAVVHRAHCSVLVVRRPKD